MPALADPSMNAAPLSGRGPAERRAYLESLLRQRKLDSTLTTALPVSAQGAPSLSRGNRADERWLAPTGISDLDRQLGGGLPRGQLSELVGPRSSGRWAILLAGLASATWRGEAVALIDPLDMFDPPSAAAAGIDLARLLWVRGEAPSSARTSLSCEYGTLQKAVDRALKSLNLVLQAGGFGLVVLDLAEIVPQVVRRIPLTTWLRIQRVIEDVGSETACVLIGSEPMARSAGGLTVALERASDFGLQAPGLARRQACSQTRPEARSLKPGACHIVRARVIRARAIRTERDVCLHLSAAIA
jgi:hypothetical protein